MTDKPYSKVEEEIIQILDQMEDDPAADPPSNLVAFRPRPKPRRELPAPPNLNNLGVLQRVRRYSAGSWVGIGLVAAFVAWQSSRFIPMLGMIAMLVSIGAFMAALYTWRTGSTPGIAGTSATTKRWRGRDIDLAQPSRESGLNRGKRWGKRRFRGPRS